MASRGSALQRALKYFREADVDEMRVAFTLAKEIVERRLTATQQDKPEKPKRRKQHLNQAQRDAAPGNGSETLADA